MTIRPPSARSARTALSVCAVAFFAFSGMVAARAEPAPAAKISPVDVKTSRVYILVDKTGFGHQHGVVGRLRSGKLTLGAAAKAGQIVFDMPSFEADTADGRKYVGLEGDTDADTRQKVNANMLGEKVLNVKEFPTATFDVDSALDTGKRLPSGHPLYELRGRFTLHGTTRPLVLKAEAVAGARSIHLRGKFTVLQTQYGMKPYTAALGAVGVADQLTIWGEIDLAP